jgi:hypothetical protein
MNMRLPNGSTLTTLFFDVPVFFAILITSYLVAFFLFATVFFLPLRFGHYFWCSVPLPEDRYGAGYRGSIPISISRLMFS